MSVDFTRSQAEAMDPRAFGAVAGQIGAAHNLFAEHGDAQDRVSKGLSEAWRGSSSGSARSNVDEHVSRIRSNGEALKNLQTAFTNAEQNVGGAHRQLMGAIQNAEANGYKVGDDFTVRNATGRRGLKTEAAEQEHQENVRSAAQNLKSETQKATQDINQAKQPLQQVDDKNATPAATELLKCPVVDSFEPEGGTVTEEPQHEADLLLTWPGINMTIDGDPVDSEETEKDHKYYDRQVPNDPNDPSQGTHTERDMYPNVNGAPNPEVPPGQQNLKRPIPTGTAVGCDGHLYAFFSTPSYDQQDTTAPGYDPKNTTDPHPYDQHQKFVTMNTEVWDMTTMQPAGVLNGVAQASAMCGKDASGNPTMYVVGNVDAAHGSRAMWSYPIDPSHPQDWAKGRPAEKHEYPPDWGGDRENQVISLKGGGYLQLDTGNNIGVRAMAACLPEQLLEPEKLNIAIASGNSLIPNPEQPDQKMGLYGPTVVADGTSPPWIGGPVTVRLSTFQGKPDQYRPRTYRYTVMISYGPPK